MTKLGVFTDQELAVLKGKYKAILKAHLLMHLRTSPAVHKIIRSELKKKHPKIRKALKAKLLPTYNRLKP